MRAWKKKSAPAPAAVTQLRGPGTGGGLLAVPAGDGEQRLYRAVRRAVPAVDAAIGKIIRLAGGGGVRAQRRRFGVLSGEMCDLFSRGFWHELHNRR